MISKNIFFKSFSSLKFFKPKSIMDDAKKVYTLYGDDISPPVRFVKITAAALGVPYKMENIDLFKGKNKSKQYTELNPLQKVPTLSYGKEVIADSHAICMHLCELFDKNYLYPEDLTIRARVQQMLFFNSTHLFPIDSKIFTDYFGGKKVIDNMEILKWNECLGYLEHQLHKFTWLADEKMTLCDLCCGATVSSLHLLVPLTDKHTKVNEWMKRLQQVKCFNENANGLEKLKLYVDKFQ